jgi:hypothetical protein
LILTYFGPFENLRQFGYLTLKRVFIRAEGPGQTIEAESAVFNGPMTAALDPSANGGFYIISGVTNLVNPVIAAPLQPTNQGGSSTISANLVAGKNLSPAVLQSNIIDSGSAKYNVNIASSGTYKIWARMWGSNAVSDAFWLSVDGATAYNFGDGEFPYGSWQWVNWTDGLRSNTVELRLEAGSHTITIYGREANTRIDTLFLTTDLSYIPGVPGEAPSISPTPTPPYSPTPTAEPSPLPSQFVLLTPKNNASGVSNNPVFDWEDSSGTTTAYWIYVASSGSSSWSWARNVNTSNASWNGGSGWVLVSSSAPTIPKRLSNGTYKWWVLARNTFGDTWALPGAFTYTVGPLQLQKPR